MNEMMRGGQTTNLVDINPYLNGMFKPIAQETTIVDCKVVGEIPRDKEIIVHCKMGGRSARAADYLRQQGYANVKNLKGGILDWSDKIDPSVPKY